MVKVLNPIKILGIMSGTSLDGIDLALCSFGRNHSDWSYKILNVLTLPYPADISDSLNNAIHMKSEDLLSLDHTYGKWIGRISGKFLSDTKMEAHWIASHGHTVFHQPSKGFTLQIGNGNDIAALTGIPVIYDFRSMDIALGGQGAPLVPAGDEYLFGKYDSCLNLGGISNISYKMENRRIAFDICPVNMGLNYIAGKMGLTYDKDGEAGRNGKIIPVILDQLNALDYYEKNPPKSLGREWFIKHVEPLLNQNYDLRDILRSFYEHIALQISNILNKTGGKNVFITGGGAKNKLLIELIRQKIRCEIIIPEQNLVDFKEALVFAFLGYLRINNIVNVFSSVTGCSEDHCAGLIVKGKV